jgi:hypothetical protein
VRKRFFGVVFGAAGLTAAALLVSAAPVGADAGGQGTVTMTQHANNVTLFSMPVTNPCTGAPGTLTAVAANEVFHVTFFTNGDEFWVTGTDEGTATFTPDHPTDASASGHFASWFGESSNNKNDVQHDTSTFVLSSTDGTHLVAHMADHFSTNANGVVTVNFSIMDFRCS